MSTISRKIARAWLKWKWMRLSKFSWTPSPMRQQERLGWVSETTWLTACIAAESRMNALKDQYLKSGILKLKMLLVKADAERYAD